MVIRFQYSFEFIVLRSDKAKKQQFVVIPFQYSFEFIVLRSRM